MKKIYILLFCLTVGLLCFSSVSADESESYTVSQEMLDQLTLNLTNIFPISSLRKNFSKPSEALYSDVGKDTMVRTEIAGGKRSIMLVVNSDGVYDHSAFDAVSEAYPTDFQFTMDVYVSDIYPENSGGCFTGFTTEGVKTLSRAGGDLTLDLVINGNQAEIYLKTEKMESGVHVPLGDLSRSNAKLSIVHLTGHTYLYVNGILKGQFHDGIRSGLRLIYGAAVFSEGDLANCSFDNLAIRKVSTK